MSLMAGITRQWLVIAMSIAMTKDLPERNVSFYKLQVALSFKGKCIQPD